MIRDKAGREYATCFLHEFKDLKELVRFVNSARATGPFLGKGNRVTLAREKSFVAEQKGRFKQGLACIVIALDGKKVVAWSSLDCKSGRESHVAILGLMVDKDYRGRGLGEAIAREALKHRTHKMKIIALEIASANKPAFHIYKKLGFREVARMKRWFKQDNGPYCDNVIMELKK